MDGKSERELIAWCISQLRRNIVGDFAYGMMRTFGEDDYSFPQLATLLYPDVEGEQTIKGVAEMLGRSLSATSRLLDQLVVRGTISRREDERDRRVKRVAITKHGRALVASVEQRRADVQIAVMNYLSPEERAQAIRGMTLLVEATKRRQEHHGQHESPAKRATRP
jgi:DNA-binding MarR family transcriptional regulator